MRNLSWMLLVLVGCGDEFANEVKDEVADTSPEKEIIWEKDGKEMVLIPAGSFEMGDHFNEGSKDEQPVHTVELDAFYMDVHEVTVGQFREFVNQSGYKPELVKAGRREVNKLWDEVEKYSPGDEYPMVYVSWNDATAYAKWAGKRLPTEAEWEYAARGGLVGKRFPGGDTISSDDANLFLTGGKDKWSKCAPVGSFEANGYGLYDMASNVWEWCDDWYDENYYKNSPVKNPPGPDIGSLRVLRDGYWSYGSNYLRVALRGSDLPNDGFNGHGFRCVSGSDYP